MTLTRRRTLGRLAAALALAPLAGAVRAQAPARGGPLVEVWKDPNCGCCKDWVVHLEQNGFTVKVNDTGNTAIRKRLKVAEKFGSCHTALVAGYALEGHVPAADVQRLLREKPRAIGLAVPGMPVGSPGMDGPEYGNRRDAYDVLLLQADGSASVFSRQNQPARKA